VIAMDWGTYRTLAGELGLTPGQVRDWIRSYYQRMFLSQAQATPPG
jgi:transposase-like protein